MLNTWPPRLAYVVTLHGADSGRVGVAGAGNVGLCSIITSGYGARGGMGTNGWTLAVSTRTASAGVCLGGVPAQVMTAATRMQVVMTGFYACGGCPAAFPASVLAVSVTGLPAHRQGEF